MYKEEKTGGISDHHLVVTKVKVGHGNVKRRSKGSITKIVRIVGRLMVREEWSKVAVSAKKGEGES